MSKSDTSDDGAWSSEGLVKQEAISQWHDHWSNRHPTPISVSLPDPDGFTARFVHYGIGPLRLLRLQAPVQTVENDYAKGVPTPLVHMLYSLAGKIDARLENSSFTLEPGLFVMLDNRSTYELAAKTPHEVIDLIMPIAWARRHVGDLGQFLGQAKSMREGWAPPLGLLLETLTLRMENCPLPRSIVAEQVGAMLALATSGHREPQKPQSGQLAWRIMLQIETQFANPELAPDQVARDLGISKRYLQSALAQAGTSFVQELNTTRLDHASELLADAETQDLTVGEIAFRCGFLDPGYFARLFRKRFGMSPRDWRGAR